MYPRRKPEPADPKDAKDSEYTITHMGQKRRVTVDEEGRRTTHFGGPGGSITTDRNGD